MKEEKMARKIKITSKVIKKWCLMALLVALVVGFGVIVIQSFGKDHNNSQFRTG